jgi:CubicO group peptidase (beta-lactamase class C family)
MQQMMIDVTGRSFESYMEDTVLKPLGMSSSTFEQALPETLERSASTGYIGTPRHAVEGRRRLKPELAAGGVWTTAGDLARFLSAFSGRLRARQIL